MVEKNLSGVTIIIFIACGVLTCALLFIFAKRQIMRFAIRARRGPHVPIGHDAPKILRREIERRLELITRVLKEPKLLDDTAINSQVPPSYYRLRAVDDVKLIEKELSICRHPSESVRSVLVTNLCGPSEPLAGPGQKLVHQFCDMYEHARHGASLFGEDEYQAYQCLYRKLIEAAKVIKSRPSSHKSSPSRTPLRRQRPISSASNEPQNTTDESKHETSV